MASSEQLPARPAARIFAEPLMVMRELERCGSVSAAAAQLGMGQPTLSRQLERWQQELGLPLVRRQGRTLALTPEGRTIAVAAGSALDILEPCLEEEVLRRRRNVRIGCLRSLSGVVAAELVRAFGTDESWQLSMQEGSSDELLAALRSDELDLVLTGPRPDTRGLAWEPIMDQEMVLTVPGGHPLTARREVDLHLVRDEQFLMMSASYTTRSLVDSLFAEVGVQPRVVIETDDVRTLRNFVAMGLGLSILPLEGGQPTPGTAELRIRRPDGTLAEREVGMVWRQRTRLPVATRSVIEFLANWRQPTV